MKRLAALLLLTLFFIPTALCASPEGLQKARNSKEAVRSVFFISGMSCRACTTILDKKIGKMEGVYWARFNFPLRLLTVYRDPKTAPAQSLAALVDNSGELKAKLLHEEPSSKILADKNKELAKWDGAKLALSESGAILKPFEENLKSLMGETPETAQVRYEILGEALRNKMILVEASAVRQKPAPALTDLPPVIAKDFYWPDSLRPLSENEKTVGAFIEERVTKKDFENGRKLFDEWLFGLYRKAKFDFRGELFTN